MLQNSEATAMPGVHCVVVCVFRVMVRMRSLGRGWGVVCGGGGGLDRMVGV